MRSNNSFIYGLEHGRNQGFPHFSMHFIETIGDVNKQERRRTNGYGSLFHFVGCKGNVEIQLLFQLSKFYFSFLSRLVTWSRPLGNISIDIIFSSSSLSMPLISLVSEGEKKEG